MTKNFAPIAIFAYSRTRHLSNTLDALECCAEFSRSQVFVYSDGAKSDADKPVVAAVRALLAARKRPNITIIEAPKNRGLANSIIDGVTELCEKYGRVIVIEDDLVVSPVTLAWLNEGLDRYSDDPRVWQISAHQFPVSYLSNSPDSIFLHLSTSWGWATWKRAWGHFDRTAGGWEELRQNSALRHRFDLNGAYPYAAMMEQQMTGQIDSWAIRWWWSVFQADGLCLFPPRSFVANLGHDETATHGGKSRLGRIIARTMKDATETRLPAMPRNVTVDREAQKAVEVFLRAQKNQSRWKVAMSWLSAVGR